MGVIIKYLVEFPDANLKVSNDITKGDFTLDATISIPMKRGMDGCSFQVDLIDLPQAKAKTLSILPSVPGGGSDTKSVLNDLGKHVTVSLGYFDGAFEKVMEGIIDSATAEVKGSTLVTTVKGLETATHALKLTRQSSTLDPGSTVGAAIQKLMNDASASLKDKGVTLAPGAGSDLSKPIGNTSVRKKFLINALNDLATAAKAEMVVGDKTVRIGKVIADNSYGPEKFVPGINLGSFAPFKKVIPDQTDPTANVLLDPTTAEGFNFAITGDPKVRPAQKVSVDASIFAADGEYRIKEVTHKFSMSGGYTCEGVVTKVIKDDNAKRRDDNGKKASADTIVDGLGQIASAHRKQSPSIEIGQIKAYTAGANGSASDPKAPKANNSDVYYGQVFDETETQPSFRVAVQNDANQVAKDKPMVSPFAWHKCGLVAPVYPGMKAVLSHNLALEDDSLVTGFIWSNQPAFDPPPNKKGDWWLSLPVFASDDDPPIPPPGDTKITNDLIAKSGLRVIEVGGLKITVGKLQALGTRPTEGAADEFLIEHKKAKIHIASDGSMEIMADAVGGKGKITIAKEGDISMTATGGVTLKVGKSAVDIS